MSSELPSSVDVLVVGGGPAGLSAALWLGRYQRSTLVVDAGRPRNRHADLAHGIPGRDPVAPEGLLAGMRAEVDRYPEVCLRSGTVTDLRGSAETGFTAVIDGVHRVRASRVVLAAGVSDRFPRVEGFEEHYGIDVHHCPACDGFEIRGQDVVVLGAGDQVPAFASELLDWAATVRIVTDTTAESFGTDQRRSLAAHGIEVFDGPATALVGEPGELAGVLLEDGTCVPGASVFFSYAHRPHHDLAVGLGCELDDEGQLVVNGFQLTSVDGVYAAGDLTPGLQLVVIAMGQGVSAGIACATSLRGIATEAGPSPAPPTRRFAPLP
ncbi:MULTISPECIES: NAD(P)/FAD-dependent oxidoreductase [Citricoccus]|uniref:NAD(P)/FAD-dependent oxidoreductase n=1 Tax=Citricoccus TaxID=169133 RepID=UPI000255F297|nr:NAD(P)/FAD-dependent oxidoreductase [Citricoccus sp. CH26A]